MIPVSKSNDLPKDTGVYLLYAEEDLLYVGKAKNIHGRVQNHLQQKPWAAKIKQIDCILLPSEEEALLTEREIIQSRRPYYNIRLRDDRSYPMIAVSLEEEYPRVFLTREKRRPERLYFGPWTDARRARKLLRVLPQIFPFRSCTGSTPGRAKNPCLDYYINRCEAPCVGKVSPKEYRKGIDRIVDFLEGRRSHIEATERQQMKEAAAQKDFERAALHRDRLRAIEKLSERGTDWGEDRNVLAAATKNQDAAVSVLEIREGRIAERRVFILRNEEGLPEEGVLEKFLELFPQKYPLSDTPELQKLAHRDARLQLIHDISRRSESSLDLEEALLSLEEIADRRPVRIEGYDIANLGESATVGAMVVFEDGTPLHRSYKTKPLQRERPDDYQSMREMIRWRSQAFLHHKDLSPFDSQRSRTLSELPDVVLIDGGAGQLGAALEVGQAMAKEGTVFLALAKREETLWNQAGPLDVSRDNPGLQLLQRVRDEAHRLSNRQHQKLRSKETFRSDLDDIPGLGAKKQAALLQHFGSIEKILSASPEELCQVPGIGQSLARKILQHLSSC